MRVDRFGQVAGRGAHFDSHDGLGEDVAGVDAHDADAQDPAAVGIDEQLGRAFGASQRDGLAAGGPGELCDFHFDAFGRGLFFGEPCPGDFGIGKDDGRDGLRLERGRFAQQGLDGHLALVRGLVRQHRLAGHVADGQDVRIGGALVLVGDDETLFIQFDVGVFQPDAGAVGTPADCDQHAAELLGAPAIGAVELNFDGIAPLGERRDFGFQIDVGKNLLQPCVERFDEVAVAKWQQGGRHLDHAHLRAELGVDGAHLQADVAAADDQQTVRHVGQRQRAGGVHHAIGLQAKGRRHRRDRSTGQNAVLEREFWLAVGRRVTLFQTHGRGTFERGAGVDDGDLAFLGQLFQPGGQRRDDLVLAGPHDVNVDHRRLVCDAPLGHLARLADDAGHVQQRLGRDAPFEQASAAQARLGLDQRDLHAHVGGQEGGGISARPAADDDQLRLHGTILPAGAMRLPLCMMAELYAVGRDVTSNEQADGPSYPATADAQGRISRQRTSQQPVPPELQAGVDLSNRGGNRPRQLCHVRVEQSAGVFGPEMARVGA